MRLVKVKAPQGYGQRIADLAFSAGIGQVSLHQEQMLSPDRAPVLKDVVDVDTATPNAKTFVDGVMEASFFDPKEFSINVRQPRTVISKENPWKVTWPLVEPTPDILEELWQFTHVTAGFIGRSFVASLLLGIGLIHGKILFIIAGLLFYPLLPGLLAASFGVCTQTWRLVGQGIYALSIGMVVGLAGGALVASFAEPPMRWTESNSLLMAALISLAVGVAGALATSDDSGERSLIGLAATAQIAMVPVSLGIFLIFGAESGVSSPSEKLLQLAVNIGSILIGSWLTYVALRFKGTGVQRCVLRASKRSAVETSA